MYINYTAQLAIYFTSLIMTLSFILFFLIKGRKTVLLYSFVAFQSLVLFWLLRIIILKILFTSEATGTPIGSVSFDDFELYHYKLRYLITCFTGLCWMIFCLLYTENNIIKNRKRLIPLVLICSGLCYIPVYFGENWFIPKEQYVYAFWQHAVARYIYYLIGIAVLVHHCIKHSGYKRMQSIMLASSILLPVILNFIQDYKRCILLTGGIIYNFDITPAGYIVTMTVIAFTTYKYKFLNVVPIALRRIVDSVDQGIVVIDSDNRVIDYNQEFSNTFGAITPIEKDADFASYLSKVEANSTVSSGLVTLRDALANTPDTSHTGEISITASENRCFKVDIRTVCVSKGKILGRSISFNDITIYKKMMDEINEKNTKLAAINERLEQYALTAEELAIERERSRFAQDIHDTLGHTLTVLISVLEVSSITCGKDNEKTHEKIQQAIQISREGLNGVRRAISGLENMNGYNLTSAMEKLASDFRTSGVDVEFIAGELPKNLDRVYSETIYRVCREAMTNSIRHGSAKRINIIIKYSDARIKLFIIDDGTGCKDINKGLGLSGIEDRIGRIGGSVVYGSDGESGFNVHVEIPMISGTEELSAEEDEVK